MLNRSIALVLLIALATASAAEPLAGNRLAGHASPYLALHADDPVHWQPWAVEAFERARREGKPLLVSSGYFSCHWCHVMQRESYRDARIAALINRHFVPVKLDRELSPAVDAGLIDFARRTRGQAGWPLHVALTPDGYPLVALLYQPPEAFEKFLRELAARWQTDAQDLQTVARDAARQAAAIQPALPARPDAAELRSALRREALAQADELAGGFGAQSKFPKAPQLLALLEVQAHAPDADLATFLRLTLAQMAGQGLRDHLGGGFFRYTEDPDWQTPHFEKMLYDNALLARVYLRAARVLDVPGYLEIARDTLEFVRRELAAPGGGYYAALSALDAAGEEGGYYLWDRQELQAVAGADWELLRRYWGLDRPAPFAGGHLPIPRMSRAQLAAAAGLPQAVAETRLDAVLARLRERRAQRRVPVGTQVLAGWNGLMLSALAEAVTSLDGGDTAGVHGRAAAALERYLLESMLVDGRLVRLRTGSGAPVPADLEDYAYVIAGLQNWQAARDAGPDAPVTVLLRQAWQRFHADGRWRLGEDALLRWDSGAELLADGPLPA
ncbi:MAG: DUF255 domain-containing protein, partial [Thauera sp.]|nr:DUF255 domain-containing protein [Thauera sp.]